MTLQRKNKSSFFNETSFSLYFFLVPYLIEHRNYYPEISDSHVHFIYHFYFIYLFHKVSFIHIDTRFITN